MKHQIDECIEKICKESNSNSYVIVTFNVDLLDSYGDMQLELDEYFNYTITYTITNTNENCIPNECIVDVKSIPESESEEEEEEEKDSPDNYLFFYGLREHYPYLSQFHPSEFVDDDGVHYNSCEQYMMSQKAKLFGAEHTYEQILKLNDPTKIKYLGRNGIKNFNDKTWRKYRESIVIQGNFYKFSQNPNLKEKLLKTYPLQLVEASRRDRIWGVGFDAQNAYHNKHKWGLNLLGKSLMVVREHYRICLNHI